MGLDGNHIPFTLDTQSSGLGTLKGHISRGSSIQKKLLKDSEVLVIFQGPSSYISPGWQLSRKEHGRVQPSWNYAVVHTYGTLKIVKDHEWILSHLEEITNTHEEGRDDPWNISEPPQKFFDELLNYIVGIEIDITKIMGKWQMSQQRKPEDVLGIIEGLHRENTKMAGKTAEFVEQANKEKIELLL